MCVPLKGCYSACSPTGDYPVDIRSGSGVTRPVCGKKCAGSYPLDVQNYPLKCGNSAEQTQARRDAQRPAGPVALRRSSLLSWRRLAAGLPVRAAGYAHLQARALTLPSPLLLQTRQTAARTTATPKTTARLSQLPKQEVDLQCPPGATECVHATALGLSTPGRSASLHAHP